MELKHHSAWYEVKVCWAAAAIGKRNAFDVRSFLGKFQIGINWLTQRKPWPNERSQQ